MTHTAHFRFNLTASAFHDGLVILDGDLEVTYVCPVGASGVEIQSIRRRGYDISNFFTPDEERDFAKVIDAAREEAAEGAHRRPQIGRAHV